LTDFHSGRKCVFCEDACAICVVAAVGWRERQRSHVRRVEVVGANALATGMLGVVGSARVEEVINTLERPVACLAADLVCFVQAVLQLNIGEPGKHLIGSNAGAHLLVWTVVMHFAIGLHKPLIYRRPLLDVLIC